MIRHLVYLLLGFGLATGASAADFAMVQIEEAAEVSRLELQPGAGDGTYIYARVCDQCEMLSLRIGDDTEVFRRRSPITMASATRLRGIGATVLFDPKTNDVTRIIFWR